MAEQKSRLDQLREKANTQALTEAERVELQKLEKTEAEASE